MIDHVGWMENPPLQPGSIHGTLKVKDDRHPLSEEKVVHPNPFQAECSVPLVGRGRDLSSDLRCQNGYGRKITVRQRVRLGLSSDRQSLSNS